jgi:antitoxin ParD1/3/4
MASSVNLGEQLEAFITDAVKNGRYGSRSEVLREGVRVIQEREKRLAKLDAQLARAVDDIEAGRTYDADEVFARLERKYSNMAEREMDAQLVEIRAGVARGIADAKAGRVVDAEEGFAELETYFRALSVAKRA